MCQIFRKKNEFTWNIQIRDNIIIIGSRKIIFTGLLFGIMVFIGEITLGNPGFPIHIYYFDKIPVWTWSVPVHVLGFVWIVFWNNRFIKKPIFVPVVFSITFFTLCEILNLSVLKLFKYSDYPLGPMFSFFMVIFLYVILCTINSIILRFGYKGKA